MVHISMREGGGWWCIGRNLILISTADIAQQIIEPHYLINKQRHFFYGYSVLLCDILYIRFQVSCIKFNGYTVLKNCRTLVHTQSGIWCVLREYDIPDIVLVQISEHKSVQGEGASNSRTPCGNIQKVVCRRYNFCLLRS